MKIGFDAKRAFLNSSGLGNYSRNTIQALKMYYPENDLILFSPEVNNSFLKNYADFNIVCPGKSSSKLYKSYWRTFKILSKIEENKPTVFHGLSNELPKGLHRSEVPGIVTIHDLIFFRFPEFYKPVDRSIYRRKVIYACRAASKIIAISQQTRNDLIEFLKVPAEKIEVLYQGISPVYFELNQTGKLAQKYNLPENFILSVGTLEKRKNQLLILKAVNSARINVPLVFVGNKTSYFHEIENYRSTQKIRNNIIYLSNIPEEDLAGLYSLASLSIYLSVFEGFGLPVIESMASSCPVITSNVTCLPETAGGAALLCSPGNADNLGAGIKKILENKMFRKELIEKGKERAKLFHPKNYAKNLISLYKSILKE